MDDDMEMRPTDKSGGYQPSSIMAGGLSRNMIIVVACIIGGGLAIGLGVGLGVGLNNVEYVYVTEKPTSAKPSSTTATTTTGVISAETTTKPAAPDTTTPETTTPEPTTTVSTTSVPSGDGPWLNFRLPEYIKPSHYKLTLQPNMTTDDYTGTNEITFDVNQNTKYVLFHAHSTLEIRSVKLMGGGTELNIVNQFRWPEYEYYVVEAENDLTSGEYVLNVDFYNSLVKAIVGIYKSTYIDPNTGIEKGVIGSDMEPTDARRGYPCFDEPAMKIKYSTTIIHEQIHTALSNMAVDTTEDIGNGLNRTVFQESVPMSTYLGCFVVAELEFIEAKSARGIPLRIYGSKYQIIDQKQADYALNVTKAMFDEYEMKLGVNYSLPKYDQIAIPNFGTGAMENWGLVTYREVNLLWDPEESSTYNKQRVAAVIGHEMVHQWFGNIVTMKWWDNIWLNEGFASYLEYRGLQWAEPDWVVNGHVVVDDLQPAMRVDASSGSHPIVVDVESPSQITEVFDTITYQKGSSVLRMMNYILGDDLFFGGLNQYLNDFEYSNANEQDLWNSVQKHIDEVSPGSYNVKEIMDPWVQQLGFPVLGVDMTTTPDTAMITQEIMLADADADLTSLPDSEYEYKWNVMLGYFTETNSTVRNEWLNKTLGDATITLPSDSGNWTKFNAHTMGYYRVNYEPDIWNTFVEQLRENKSVINEVDRANLLDDAMNLAPAGKITYTQALEMTTYLEMEDSYFVWRAFSSGSGYIEEMLRNTESYMNFQTYYLRKVKPISDEVGWDTTEGTHEEKRMRPYVLGLALSYDDMEALANATALFADWRAGAYIHPDVRSLVYRYGIEGGTTEDWEFMLDKYKTETVAGEKTNLLRGLAATEDVVLIDRLLNYSKDPSIIRDQDFFSCITYISYTVNGNKMAWSWVRVNWDYLVERFTIQDRNLGRLVPSIVEYYNTELQKWEVESFFESEPEAGAGELNRKNALIQIDLNIAWMAANAEDIGQWLMDNI